MSVDQRYVSKRVTKTVFINNCELFQVTTYTTF